MRFLSSLHKNRNPERGATVVEFAVVASLLFLILLGVLEFGFFFLQEHFVANAAREGVRIGIRADNYDSIADSDPSSPEIVFSNNSQLSNCNGTSDRAFKVDCRVRDYLETLYPDRNALVTLKVTTDSDGSKNLSVRVEEANFFPFLLTGFIPGFNLPERIAFTAAGGYENSEEK